MTTTTQSGGRAIDWIMFFVSTLIMVLMLMYADEWFWLALPFVCTYLVKAFDAM